jgi:outer membrane protein assembly factor BamB
VRTRTLYFVTLDAEVRALERVAKSRPDDGAAQVGLAAALVRMGRSDEALEAFIRAASAEPGDAEVGRALGETSWWSGPRGSGGGGRWVSVPGLRRAPSLVAARRLGQGGAGLALGRGIVFARVTEEAGDARLVALALATGRELWSREETVGAAAPPIAFEDSVIDATLVEGAGSVVFRVRARDAASGADRWVRTSELSDAQAGAIFKGASLSGKHAAFAIEPHGKKAFLPFVRVLDASSGAPLDGFSLGKLSDLALEGDAVYFATDQEPRRIVGRKVDGVRLFDAFRGHKVQRLAAAGDHLVVATEERLACLRRRDGEVVFSRPLRIGALEALVVTPRAVIGSWQRQSTSAFALPGEDRLWGDEPISRMLAAAEDTLYSVTGDGLAVRALDLATGELLWSVHLRRLAPELAGAGVHKLAVAPSRLVGLTKEGVFFLLA